MTNTDLIFIKPYEKTENLLFKFREKLIEMQDELVEASFWFESDKYNICCQLEELYHKIEEIMHSILQKENYLQRVDDVEFAFDSEILATSSLFKNLLPKLEEVWSIVTSEDKYPKKPFQEFSSENNPIDEKKLDTILSALTSITSLSNMTRKVTLDLKTLFRIPPEYDEDQYDLSLENIVPPEIRDYYSRITCICNLHFLINDLVQFQESFSDKIAAISIEEEDARKKYEEARIKQEEAQKLKEKQANSTRPQKNSTSKLGTTDLTSTLPASGRTKIRDPPSSSYNSSQMSSLTNPKSCINQNVSQNQNSMKENDEQIEKLKNEIEKLKAENSTLTLKNVELTDKVEELEIDIENNEKFIDDNQKKQKQISELQTSLKSQIDENDRLQLEVENLQIEIAKRDSVSVSFEQYDQEIKSKEQIIHELTEKLNSMEISHKSIQSRNEQMQLQNKDLQNQLELKIKELEVSNNKVLKELSAYNSLHRKYQSVKQNLRSLANDMINHSALNDTERQELVKLRLENIQLRKDYQIMYTDLQNFEKAKEKALSSGDQIKILKAQLLDAHQKITLLNDINQNLNRKEESRIIKDHNHALMRVEKLKAKLQKEKKK
ncbi:hypothetical protein TRFO_01770 [Tritrichomonas foetus]|uniref:Uncharacterized protein n=1 Tax=Tritrichomonas foetus TaxID=1144522 RepID=A0A1J4JUG1_9EUKA|nr:hypothetical protein TRFO_01770 [Tritrichomonas foetus]|eukprot:OHT01156.1 hypothetical protein TRFO_01770 [Tritrichomonas foetus]